GGGIAGIDEHRPDQRLADVGEDRGAAAAAGMDLGGAEANRVPERDRARHVGAGFLAHEVGETARKLALVGLRARAKQLVRDDKPEAMVAEDLEPLVGGGAIAHAVESGNVGQRLLEQGRFPETIADAILELAAAAASLRRLRARLRSPMGVARTGGLA